MTLLIRGVIPNLPLKREQMPAVGHSSHWGGAPNPKRRQPQTQTSSCPGGSRAGEAIPTLGERGGDPEPIRLSTTSTKGRMP